MENTPPPSMSPVPRTPLVDLRCHDELGAAAPKKVRLKRAAVGGQAVSPKIRRRLVFESRDDEVGDENDPEAAMSADDGCVATPSPPSSSSTFVSFVDTQIVSCGCTPESRHLLCCELVSLDGSVSVARCPVCDEGGSYCPSPWSSGSKRLRRASSLCAPLRSSPRTGCSRRTVSVSSSPRPDTARPAVGRSRSRKQSFAACSDEHIIASPFVGLKCHMSTFHGLRGPTLRESRSSGGYLPVYVPHDGLFCDTNCCRRSAADGATVIGRGSFGEVWRLGDGRTALKVGRETLDETLLTTWISGVVRGRAEAVGLVGERNDGVYCNILTATGCCLKHNVVSFSAFDRDLYNYKGWHFSGLSSYRRVFTGLADALRFLNLRCHVGHFDVTPMNCLVEIDPEDERKLKRAVICDYSLSQYTGPYDERCVVVFQQNRTVRALQGSAYFLTDLYHPAFKPLMLQKLSVMEPRSRFPEPSVRRFCVADLCALGGVAAFCLVRTLDERGLGKVRVTTENALFEVARRTCEALGRHDEDAVANYSSLLLTRQIAYAVSLLGVDEARDAVDDLCRFFATNADEEAVDRFRQIYKRARQEISGANVIRLLREALACEDGRYMIENIRATCLSVRSEDLDADPFSLFP